jgi:pilus assembly protein CpaE
VAYAQDGLEAAQLSYRLRPDVAIIWEDLVGLRGHEACEIIVRTAPEVACVMITRAASDEAHSLAMLAGARAVIDMNSLDNLPELLVNLITVRNGIPLSAIASVTEAERAPLVIMVTGSRGGAGKTTVAVNLSVCLAQRPSEKVALLEIPGQLGDGAVFLDVVPTTSFLGLTQMPALDHDVATNSLVHHASGVKFLPATSEQVTSELSQFDRATTAVASDLLGMLKRTHSVVVLDCPPAVWPLTSYLARRSHIVILVASIDDIVAVRNSAILTDLLRTAGVSVDSLVPVVNKATASGFLKPDDVAKAAGWSSFFTIPYEPASSNAAINEGTPLVLRTPNSVAARAISQLAEQVLIRGRRIAQGSEPTTKQTVSTSGLVKQ